MGTLKDIFKFIYYNLVKNESDLKADSKFSEDEIAEIARRYAESIEWNCGDDLVQQPPHLRYEQKRLVWDVFFQPLSKGLPYAGGGHLRLFIDDETGRVIKKLVGTR